MDLANMPVKDIAQLDGVSDLPTAAKGRFALALQAEARGQHDKAAKHLDAALAAESK